MISTDQLLQRIESQNRRITLLEDEILTLKEMVRAVATVDSKDFLLSTLFGLTPNEGLILALLLKETFGRYPMIYSALYVTRIDNPPDPNIIKVFMCKLRKKMKIHGIDVALQWGQGYYLTKENKEKIMLHLNPEPPHADKLS